MKFFFIVGENSGDALAAPLISTLREKHGDNIECSGIGGPLMKESGFDELLPMDQISIMGIWEVLPKIPRLLKLKNAIVEEIEKQQPDAVITVDFPDFNFLVAKALKKRGKFKGKVIHYVAPSVWAWRPERAKKVSQFLDGIMCLFPMEVEHFTKHGLKAEHVGHPVIASGARDASAEEFRAANNIPKDAQTIGLFFGSREAEFKRVSESIKQSMLLINDVHKDLHIIIPTIPSKEYEVQSLLQDFELPVYVSANPNMKWQAFKSCDAAIAVSGTVGLELAYAGVPHVIAYKANAITALLIKFLAKVKYAHLANILLDKNIIPEFLQGRCIPNLIAQDALALLQDKEKSDAQKEAFKELGTLLGEGKEREPSQNAMDFIMKLVA
ncbi:MAG: lipid-A-disaccharide synthase [Alphaproteobacteria bacterium]